MSVMGGPGLTSAQVAARQHTGYPPGHFMYFFEGTLNTGAAIPSANRVYLARFRVYAPITVTLLYMNCVVAGAGSAVKPAIWRNDYAKARPTGLPVISVDAGFDTATTGRKEAAIASVHLDAGVYYRGAKATGTMPVMWNAQQNTAETMGAHPWSDVVNAGNTSGYWVSDTYANDIGALDLTNAVFTPESGNGIPIIGLGWA